jgi:CheY-like chemotaxis protein
VSTLDRPAAEPAVTETTVSEFKISPVLIVDDDADVHLFLKRQLVRLGVSAPLLSVSDGSHAVKYLDACQSRGEPFPCLLFLDIKMPEMSGFEVLEWMRARQLLGRLSVAMLSASEDPADVRRAIALGAHAYLTKPPPDDVLAGLVKSVVRLASRKQPDHSRREKVLIVDDSSFARRTTRRIFELLGYDVVEATDGPSALVQFADTKPDLVLLDLVMPGGMYGQDVLRLLRATSPSARIIVATADTQDTTAHEVLSEGALGIVNKPLTAEKLGAVLRIK